MRRLIRPTLFALARLGLFLAVVNTLVCQWYEWSITVAEIPNITFAYGAYDKGLGFGFVSGPSPQSTTGRFEASSEENDSVEISPTASCVGILLFNFDKTWSIVFHHA